MTKSQDKNLDILILFKKFRIHRGRDHSPHDVIIHRIIHFYRKMTKWRNDS